VCSNCHGCWIASSFGRKTRALLVRSAPLQLICPKDSISSKGLKTKGFAALPASLHYSIWWIITLSLFNLIVVQVFRDTNGLLSAFTSKKRGGKGCHGPLFSIPFVSWVQQTGLHLHLLSNEECLCLLRPIPLIWFLGQDWKFLTMSTDYSTRGVRAFAMWNSMCNTVSRTSETSLLCFWWVPTHLCVHLVPHSWYRIFCKGHLWSDMLILRVFVYIATLVVPFSKSQVGSCLWWWQTLHQVVYNSSKTLRPPILLRMTWSFYDKPSTLATC